MGVEELYRNLSSKQKKAFRVKAAGKLMELGIIDSDHNVKNTDMWDKLEAIFGAGNVLKTLQMRIGQRAIKRAERKAARNKSQAFYDSDAWKRLRYQALKLHGARCQCCGATRSDNVQIHVDHIKPRSKYPELELELSNLQILCEPCNIGKSALDETDWRDQPKTKVTMIWN